MARIIYGPVIYGPNHLVIYGKICHEPKLQAFVTTKSLKRVSI